MVMKELYGQLTSWYSSYIAFDNLVKRHVI